LSERRVASVKDYVVKKGVDGGRVSGQGFGESKPIADNKTAAGRAKNRRVEIKVN
jgi:outer membrane protein OmpA-like peptidoglycan-associated protein